MIRFLRSFLALAVVLLVALPARADEAAARQHFRRGVDLYDAKQYGPALESFLQAYREKPSAGIKQNIALSLKGLGRIVEAATAFDEALDEGEKTLRPETRAAIDRELAELSKIVATVHLTIVGDDGKPLEADVTVDGAPVSRAAVRRPIRLAQGIHVFRARAQGFPDPPEKKLALRAGEPVDATFMIGNAPKAEGTGTLTVRTNNPDAVIRVDGNEVGRGTFSGQVSAGRHEVQVSAPGYKTTSVDVALSAGASVDYPVELRGLGEAPGAYQAPDRKPPPKEKKGYVTILGGLETASYHTTEALSERLGGQRRAYFGGLLGVRGGYQLTKVFGVEVALLAGATAAKYKLPGDPGDVSTTMGHWQITPGVRFHTPGKVRFTAGTGFGVHGVSVIAKIPTMGRTDDRRGSGVAFSWLTDAGAQFEAGSILIEVVAFTDVHGVGPVRDSTGNRLLYSSPEVRLGARMGITFLF